jgi:UDP-N-acetyl-D-mannosaminouronate:lipid I N-acetyl-D-mannosaminouronosyltransferase
MNNDIKQIEINGLKVFPFKTREDLLTYVDFKGGILVAVNAEKILDATSGSRQIINNNIGYCDGIGAVWAAGKHGINAVKIPGCELWLDIILKNFKKKTFYLVGSTEIVISKVIQNLRNDYPSIQIIGYRNGYIKTEEEKKQLLQDIKVTEPDIVFVAMGSPRQELILQEMQRINPKAIYQGLGGSFDVYTGTIKRAPKIWINAGLEWAYRWLSEPKSRSKRTFRLIQFYYKLKTNQF